MAKKKATKSDDDFQREFWKQQGGDFHGPNIETGTMPEVKLLPLLRKLRKKARVHWGPVLPGSTGKTRVLYINDQKAGMFERWEESTSLDDIDGVLRSLADVGAIDYDRKKDEWL